MLLYDCNQCGAMLGMSVSDWAESCAYLSVFVASSSHSRQSTAKFTCIPDLRYVVSYLELCVVLFFERCCARVTTSLEDVSTRFEA